jgi:hypothetical protein
MLLLKIRLQNGKEADGKRIFFGSGTLSILAIYLNKLYYLWKVCLNKNHKIDGVFHNAKNVNSLQKRIV